MNYLQEIIQKILEDYGLSIDDQFVLRYAEDNEQIAGVYRFNKRYKLEVQRYDRDNEEYWMEDWNTMEKVLSGLVKIWPLPFRPAAEDPYYFVTWPSWTFSPIVKKEIWYGSSNDFMRFYFGNVYRTEEQAMADRERVQQRIIEASK